MENKAACEQLYLKNQLCFPLYACAKEVVRLYTPHLDPLGITYTQYLVLLVLWEKKNVTVKQIGEMLWLDSGTLTPLLKKLVTRTRSRADERSVVIALTKEGWDLRDQAEQIPAAVCASLKIPPEEAAQLYDLLYKVLGRLSPAAAD